MASQQQPATNTIFGGVATTNAGTPGPSTAFSFRTTNPTTGFGAFGGGTFSQGGSAFSGTPATGTSGVDSCAFTASSMGSTSSASSLPFWKSHLATTSGATFANASSLMTTSTSTVAYSVTSVCDRQDSGLNGQFITITAMPAYTELSLEELRLQDYQRSGKITAVRQKRSGKSDPTKQDRWESLLRQSLLEEFVDIRFHLFSARSPSSGRVMKPRVLRTNSALLAENSKYFLDLLNVDVNPSDSSWVVLRDGDDIPNDARIDDYGYEDDSDLDDCDDHIANLDTPKDPLSTTSSNTSAESQPRDDDGLSKNGAGLVGSSGFAMIPKQFEKDDSFSANEDEARSVASDKTAVQKVTDDNRAGYQTAMCLQSLGGRHVLVKDTAFQTLYAFLNYLYTDKVNFLPLSSASPSGHHESSTSFLDEPRCSAKSMYRLATKVGVDYLREEALAHIQSQLTEHNILEELSCILASRYSELLEMELDVLHSLITSHLVITHFPALAERIANKELPHGADIIVGIYTRFLTQLHPFLLKPAAPLTSLSRSPEPAKADVGTGETPKVEDIDRTGSSHADKEGSP